MRLTIVFLIAICLLSVADRPEIRKYVITGQAQGTTYQVIYYTRDSVVTKKQVDSILIKLDSSLSLYKSYSLINRFNASDSGLVSDDHFLTVLRKSLATFHETGGIFDVTVQPLVQAWGFGPTQATKLPDSATILQIKKCVGSQNLKVSGHKVVKKTPCVKVDLDGIAQGYSVDVIARFLDRCGVKNYMIELGGEIRLKGRKQPGNEKMKIGIETPGDDDFETGIMQTVISLDEGSITTSGNYRRYFESEGKRISHLIDPRTGYPIQNELISITIYAKDAITADAFDNALMVMGLEKAMDFVEKRTELAAHFIYKAKDGSIKDTMSSRFSRFVHQ